MYIIKNSLFTPIVYLSFIISMYGGNDPCSATTLDIEALGSTVFDNSLNSDSGVEAPPYGLYIGPDTWLSFIMPYNGSLPMVIGPGTMTNPAIAVYSGDCFDLKLHYNVLDHNCNDEYAPAIEFDELIPGEEYFIRIWPEAGSPNGSFDISFDISIDQPVFLVYADAYITADGCIQLTEEQNSQHGCAWLEDPIDFSQPFTHTMSAYFGDIDANGADGICLVYQTNGSDYCGNSGQGIGAENIPNSVIIEFDTWQNVSLNDPPEDHCAINLNGNMNHNVSIDGPVSLTNIEDGSYHTIEFSWEPTTNAYVISFDGIDILSGNFDFITNAFGGQTDVWWGYTSSTGGAFNNQIICPIIPDPIFLGTQEYQEITICDGDQYFGYTESGFYIEYVPGSNNCLHQLNILLEVIPPTIPYEITDSICANEYYYFNGIVYSEPGSYTIPTYTDDGCDSTIILELNVMEIDFSIYTPDTLNCNNGIVNLSAYIYSIYPDANFVYNWNGPTGPNDQSNYDVSIAGNYTLNLDVIYNDLTCSHTDNINVVIDTLKPVIPDFEDVFISCGETLEPIIYSIPDSAENVTYTWYYNNTPFSNSNTVQINDIGSYLIEAIDPLTGCTKKDSFSIIPTGDIPTLSTKNDTLTCDIKEVKLNMETASNVVNYIWTFNGDSISDLPAPIINAPGIYEITVIDEEGCSNTKKLEIFLNLQSPIVAYKNDTIPCNTPSIEIKAIERDTFSNYSWNGPSGFFSTEINLLISEEGMYTLTVTDPTNGCITLDSLFIVDLGNSPIAIIESEILDCNNPGFTINPIVDDGNAIFYWEYNDQFFSNEQNPFIDAGGTYQVSINSLNGCDSYYTVFVASNMEAPPLNIDIPDTLNCGNPFVNLNPNVSNEVSYLWIGPNGFQSNDKNPKITHEGTYELTIIDTTNGCITIASVEVIAEGTYPDFYLAGNDLDCSNESSILRIISDENYESIEWEGPNSFSVLDSTQIEIFNEGVYSVVVINEFGCQNVKTIQIIDSSLTPNLVLLSSDTIHYESGIAYEILTYVDVDADNIVSVQWEPAINLSCDDCFNPIFFSEDEENIDYTLKIINAQGCYDEIIVSTRFKKVLSPVVIIAPNIIKTTGSIDPSNSKFTLYGSPQELIDKINFLIIYDRWGNSLFRKPNFPINDLDSGWDGTFKGQYVNPGVYVFHGEVLLLSGEVMTLIGDITIIR